MKKPVIVLVLSVILLFGLTTTSFAMTNYVHMSFSTTNNAGCAACHVTHAADAAKLLAGGDGTQTGACYVCHGENGQSPFDVEDGLVAKSASYDPTNVAAKIDWTSAGTNPSNAGGFKQMKDWADGDRDGDKAETLATKSAHNVEGINFLEIGGDSGATFDAAHAADYKIPGGGVNLGGAFKCGSCHDPHNVDSAGNPRLLKKTLPAAQNLSVTISYDDADTNLATGYNLDLNDWCAGCHDYLNQGDDAAKDGHDFGGDIGVKYMHPMGVKVFTSKIDASLLDKSSGFALTDNDELLCITCHRVHGSTAAAENDAAVYYDANGTSMGGSALLRFNDRGVCYNCHGAAEKNLEHNGTPGYDPDTNLGNL